MRNLVHRAAALALGACVSLLAPSAHAQDFINLDFEQVQNLPAPGDDRNMPWDDAAPGWAHSEGDWWTASVFYASATLGGQMNYVLIDAILRPGSLLAGDYSLGIRSGVLFENPRTFEHGFLAQTGAIPDDARSLRLLATGEFEVFVGGVEIEMVSLGGNAWGGDISSFAGTVNEVRLVNAYDEIERWVVFDNVEFSAQAVPEPAAAALWLAGLGALTLARRRRLHRRR